MASTPVFSEEAHRAAVLRRRIKFVVEKSSMVRLFEKDSHRRLQTTLVAVVTPERLAAISSQDDYDAWLMSVIKDDIWAPFSKRPLAETRWGHFAKLVNIVVYEVLSNRELATPETWDRLKHWIHVPIDSFVLAYLRDLNCGIPELPRLRGMSAKDYWAVQWGVRELAAKHRIPPIWIDDAWTPAT